MTRCRDCRFHTNRLDEYPCYECKNFDRFVPKPEYFIEEEDVPVTAGVKFDKDKPQWSLLPMRALSEVVDVLTYGAKKYAPDNWKKVPSARTRYIDAAFRHFTAYIKGEKNDSETGYNHLAHAICCLLFLLAFENGDDRD